MTACGIQWEVDRKSQEISFVESFYDDTGLPLTHARATRSVYTTHTPILSLCVLLSATLLFNCNSGELELAPPYI